MKKATDKEWNEFVKTYIDTESETSNVKADFSIMTKKMAIPYFEYLKAAWVCNKDIMTEEEFRKINGNIPQKFFEEKIKPEIEKQFEIENISEKNNIQIICFKEKFN